jgi:hypothetical protein
VSEAAPAGGVEVAISGADAAAEAPGRVFVPTGEQEAPFVIKTNAVSETIEATPVAALAFFDVNNKCA